MEQHHCKILEEENGNNKSDLIKNVFPQYKVVDTFQPWPSIEEVRNKRSSLQSIKNRFIKESKKKQSFNEISPSLIENDNNVKNRNIVEIKCLTDMIKEKDNDKKTKNYDNYNEKVSSSVPLKKKNIFSKGKLLSTAIATASNGADYLLGKSGNEKEDKIKLTRRMDVPLKTFSDPVCRMAPRVEFGDDDSPRVVPN
ncbi:Hypothetical protein SRAE_1000113000 [Strongyloides ratti]|uniref:Uncharacterized protein n=1 Tax=Strongyloides ratti TaxID=34506 RepID=A0A090MVE7_STRRB|nr:Hypothetical protein SRAE_1000113000 [Strongyloides ratti]CEF62863.1 Hypothetical protein SRAE_1000113000 [Strongyloides ratti]